MKDFNEAVVNISKYGRQKGHWNDANVEGRSRRWAFHSKISTQNCIQIKCTSHNLMECYIRLWTFLAHYVNDCCTGRVLCSVISQIYYWICSFNSTIWMDYIRRWYVGTARKSCSMTEHDRFSSFCTKFDVRFHRKKCEIPCNESIAY